MLKTNHELELEAKLQRRNEQLAKAVEQSERRLNLLVECRTAVENLYGYEDEGLKANLLTRIDKETGV